MKYLFLIFLINLGYSGRRHQISGQHIDLTKYKTHKAEKAAKLEKFMHDNGIGV